MNDLDLAILEYDEAIRTAKGRARVDPFMRRLELSLRKAFREQGTRFLRKFRAQLRSRFAEGFEGHAAFLTTPLKEAIAPNEWWAIWYEVATSTARMLEGPIDDAVRKALQTGAINTIGELGLDLSFTLENPRAVTYLQDYGARLVAHINETTRDELQTILTQAVNEGWSYDRAAQAIIDRFEEFAVGRPQAHIDSRAHMVAVTEIGNAYAEGNMIVARDLQAAGLVMEKYWSTVGDDKVSQTVCKPNEDAGWIPLDQPFPSGHMRPLGHPGCRCDLKTRRKGS